MFLFIVLSSYNPHGNQAAKQPVVTYLLSIMSQWPANKKEPPFGVSDAVWPYL